jgi:hypothetical protein
VVRRTHSCRRCGAAIDPGDVYSAVDVLDAEGRLRGLLCRGCGADLRAFVGGTDTGTGTGTGAHCHGDAGDDTGETDPERE